MIDMGKSYADWKRMATVQYWDTREGKWKKTTYSAGGPDFAEGKKSKPEDLSEPVDDLFAAKKDTSDNSPMTRKNPLAWLFTIIVVLAIGTLVVPTVGLILMYCFMIGVLILLAGMFLFLSNVALAPLKWVARRIGILE